MEEELQEQSPNRHPSEDKPWLFKPGQSGNPKGRKPGSSLKDYAKRYLSSMTDEEREKYFVGMDKKTVWEMAEGKAPQTVDSTVKVELPQPLLNVLHNNSNKEADTTGEED